MDQVDGKYTGNSPLPNDGLIFGVEMLDGLLLYYAMAFVITGVIFPLAYQLLVDKQMKGWAAVKLSAKAARAILVGSRTGHARSAF